MLPLFPIDDKCNYFTEKRFSNATCGAYSGWFLIVDDFGNCVRQAHSHCAFHANLMLKELQKIKDKDENVLEEIAILQCRMEHRANMKNRQIERLIEEYKTQEKQKWSSPP